MGNKNTAFPQTFTLNIRGKLLLLNGPKVMGIINITPDSFYDGGKLKTDAAVLGHAEKMLAAGAEFIDVGGMSTRPGASHVSTEEELRRVLPVIALLRKNFPDAILSVDTFRAVVAKKAWEAGAHIINDISAGRFDEKMFETVASLHTPYIMMHIQGVPQTMQQAPHYKDVVDEVLQYFINQTEAAQKAGIHDIIIDVGFGFGKTIEHNYALLKHLSAFKILEKPILAGLSRKSMIYKLLHERPVTALNGTTIVNTLALLQGVHILRVHDVKEATEVIKIVEFYKNT